MKNKSVKEYLATIGKKGGKSKTPKKQAASRANIEKATAARWPAKLRTLKVPCPKEECKITNGHEHI